MISRTGSDDTWSSPQRITSRDTIKADSQALCVVADPTYMGGVRVYYGSGDREGIQELEYDIKTDMWSFRVIFIEEDFMTGVGCTLQNGDNEVWVNLYLRSSNSGTIHGLWWRYGSTENPSQEWTWGKSHQRPHIPSLSHPQSPKNTDPGFSFPSSSQPYPATLQSRRALPLRLSTTATVPTTSSCRPPTGPRCAAPLRHTSRPANLATSRPSRPPPIHPP